MPAPRRPATARGERREEQPDPADDETILDPVDGADERAPTDDDEEEPVDGAREPADDDEEEPVDARREAAESDDAEEPPAEQPRGSRRENRVQRLANQKRADEDRIADLERQLAEVQGHTRGRNERQTLDEERRQLELMTPEERLEYRQQQSERRFSSQMQQTEFRLADQVDKAAFDAKVATDPVYERYADDVEDRLATLRKQGQNVGREQLLKYVIGERALERRKSDGPRQRRRGADEVRRQSVRPGEARTDAGRRGRQEQSLEDRLADQEL